MSNLNVFKMIFQVTGTDSPVTVTETHWQLRVSRLAGSGTPDVTYESSTVNPGRVSDPAKRSDSKSLRRQ